MDIFDAEFLQMVRSIAVFVGLVYAPILFANGIMDVVLKFRQLWRN